MTRPGSLRRGTETRVNPRFRVFRGSAARFDATKHRALSVVGDAQAGLTELSAGLAGWQAPAAWLARAAKEYAAWNQTVDQHSGPTNAEVPSYAHVVGAINRRPPGGDIRSNLAAGGTAEATELNDTELEICAALGPELKRRGLLFVGIDVIGGKWLTEINVTSPTGIVAIDKFNGTDTAGRIWDAIEARLAGRGGA